MSVSSVVRAIGCSILAAVADDKLEPPLRYHCKTNNCLMKRSGSAERMTRVVPVSWGSVATTHDPWDDNQAFRLCSRHGVTVRCHRTQMLVFIFATHPEVSCFHLIDSMAPVHPNATCRDCHAGTASNTRQWYLWACTNEISQGTRVDGVIWHGDKPHLAPIESSCSRELCLNRPSTLQTTYQLSRLSL